uniref:Uncharacterized protein n=1 Tax=Eptatretus burgeri TaxID=7764 RepID=A0A8C4NAP9_EPTBU
MNEPINANQNTRGGVPVMASSPGRRRWTVRFEEKSGDFCGFVLNVQDAVELIRQYELETSSVFIITNQTKNFGHSDLAARPHRVCWRDTRSTLGASLTFDGIPYIVLGKRRMECQNGPDRNKALKERLIKEKQEANGVDIICKHKTVHNTKKLGCSALIIIREIAKLPQFKVLQPVLSDHILVTERLRVSCHSTAVSRVSNMQVRREIYLLRNDARLQHGWRCFKTLRLQSKVFSGFSESLLHLTQPCRQYTRLLSKPDLFVTFNGVHCAIPSASSVPYHICTTRDFR